MRLVTSAATDRQVEGSARQRTALREKKSGALPPHSKTCRNIEALGITIRQTESLRYGSDMHGPDTLKRELQPRPRWQFGLSFHSAPGRGGAVAARRPYLWRRLRRKLCSGWQE